MRQNSFLRIACKSAVKYLQFHIWVTIGTFVSFAVKFSAKDGPSIDNFVDLTSLILSKFIISNQLINVTKLNM